MWQDYAIMAVQAIFAIALIPTITDKAQKPAVPTSLLNGFGMVVLTVSYLTLRLWLGSAVASVVCVQWLLLAWQRHKLDVQMGGRTNWPLGKWVQQILFP
jgi:hypothetical protein